MSDKSKSLFPGFECLCQAVAAGEIRLRCGGSGPPLVLLHGNPQTHLMWPAVAPSLAREFTVYCPDIRGYGISPKPSSRADSGAYAKRAMAGDTFELMDHFGHARFAIVRHARGPRFAPRLALHRPARVTTLALPDFIPTI